MITNRQLVELERNQAALAAQGLGVCAVSYDSVEILRHFAERKKITRVPLLADVGSKVIAAFGILRSAWTGKEDGGLPNPGTYLVDPAGTVLQKDFQENYHERINMDSLRVTKLGADPLEDGFTAQREHLALSVRSSTRTLWPGNVFSLLFDLTLEPKRHIYTPAVPEGYLPARIAFESSEAYRVQACAWPEGRPFKLEGLDEVLPVYEGSVKITPRLVLHDNMDKLKEWLADPARVRITGKFHFQACDERACYPPESIAFELSIPLEDHDWTRVPEALRIRK